MAEREVVVDKKRITFEGLFDAKELYKLIDVYFEDRNYDKREAKNVEVVDPDGKFVEIELEFWKKYTDYYKNVIFIRFIMTKLKEVEIEKNKQKININQGKVQLVFDAWIETDYENRWETKGVFFFVRTLFNKYFYRPYTLGYHASVRNDLNALVVQVTQFLNLFKKG